MGKHLETLVLTLLIAGVLAFGVWHNLVPKVQTAREEAATAGRPVLRILFVGNSYTFFHDMPAMLASIAASVPEEKYKFAVETVAAGGATLAQHARNPALLQKIAQGGYAAVILQEQSTTSLFTDGVAESIYAFRDLGVAAHAAGAVPFLYGTWPRRRDDAFYRSPVYSNFTPPSGPEDMMNAIDRHYALAVKAAGAPYIPVGHYFLRAEREKLALYENDGSHPNLKGSYLAALVLYHNISQTPAPEIKWAPQGLPEQDAEALRAIAAR